MPHQQSFLFQRSPRLYLGSFWEANGFVIGYNSDLMFGLISFVSPITSPFHRYQPRKQPNTFPTKLQLNELNNLNLEKQDKRWII